MYINSSWAWQASPQGGWWSATGAGFGLYQLSYLYGGWARAKVSGSKDGMHMVLATQIIP